MFRAAGADELSSEGGEKNRKQKGRVTYAGNRTPVNCLEGSHSTIELRMLTSMKTLDMHLYLIPSDLKGIQGIVCGFL